jgi:hypothetical protein
VADPLKEERQIAKRNAYAKGVIVEKFYGEASS